MGLKTFLFSVQAGRGMDDDYWVGDFDKDKNCQQEKKIEKLINEVGVPSQVLQKLFDHFAGK